MDDQLQGLEQRLSRLSQLALECRKAMDLHRQLAEEEITKLARKSKSLSLNSSQEKMEELKSQLASIDAEVLSLDKAISMREEQVREAKEELSRLKDAEKENRNYPKERYAVNLYRDISKVKFQSDSHPTELKGFIGQSQSGQIKTFCFDPTKQSEFFITNSLWEMGDEENW